MKIGIGLSLARAATPPDEGGGGELPEAPEGFAYLVNGEEDKYIVNADDAYILAKVG